MSPLAFDTLSASKRLREAGMEEGVAEAVVSIFQHAAEPVDISHLATKEDLARMATKEDIAGMATKADIKDMATRADIQDMATKADIRDMATKADVANLRADLSEKIRLQGWAMMAGTATIITVATAIIKLA